MNMIENTETFCNIQWNHFTCHHNKSNDIEHLFYISHLGSWNPPSENDTKTTSTGNLVETVITVLNTNFETNMNNFREHSKSDFVLFYGYCN